MDALQIQFADEFAKQDLPLAFVPVGSGSEQHCGAVRMRQNSDRHRDDGAGMFVAGMLDQQVAKLLAGGRKVYAADLVDGV